MNGNSEYRRFRIDLAYDGRPFDGWGSQPDGNTIQDYLLKAAKKICPSITTVQGSGRTDAGVSAENQVAHFDVPSDWRMGPEEWLKALNANLPPTIRIHACREVIPDFHARFSALGKTYCYEICTGPVLPPLKYRLAWHRPWLGGIEKDRLREAVEIFVGEHDFRSFSANRNDGKDETRNTIRSITAATADFSDDEIVVLTFSGNGFLYKMVRFLVATSVLHAMGKISGTEIRSYLAGENPGEKAPLCAPPDGLTLKEVRYEVELMEFSRD